MKQRTFWATAAIALAAVALGLWIILGPQERHSEGDEHGHGQAKEAPVAKGPHGGRLLSQGDFSLEVAIFEKGVPPEFHVYAFDKGKPLDPAQVSLQIELRRLGAPPEKIGFRKTGEFLRGDRVVEEPHSFKVAVAATRAGQAYRWEYEQAEGRVRMDEATAKAAGIAVQAAGPAKIRSTLQLAGEITFNRDRLAHVVPRLAGVVVSAAKNLGDPVRKGDVLAILQSQALGDLKSEHLATRRRLELAQTTFQREKKLWEDRITAEQDYLASRQALAEAEIAHRNLQQKLLSLGLTQAAVNDSGADLTRFELRSPIDGQVIAKNVAAGEAVKEDATLFTVADLSAVWVEMTVYPRDLDAMKAGQKVTVRSSASSAEAEGRIAHVGALVGEQTRSAKARAVLQNPKGNWRPGLFVSVEVVQSESAVAVAVPVEAVQTLRDWKVVFGRFGDVFEARPVELGRSDGKMVEVLRGLEPGQPYAASGSFVLKADLGKAGASHDH